MTTNPYAAPRAQVADERTLLPGNFVPRGRGVAAGRGWDWIAAAWNLFRAAPGTWIGMGLVFAVLLMLAGIIPLVGVLAPSVLWPAFVAGFAAASRSCEQSGSCEFSELFAGFRERFGSLVVVGLISLAVTAVVFIVVFAVMGVGMLGMMGGNMDPQAMAAVGMGMVLAVLIATALLLPLFMATWFAPLLVFFHGTPPLEAMKASFVGCLKNVLPFLIYGAVLFVAAIVASIPLGLGWLVLGPVAAASIYTAYRDIYFTE